MGTASGKRRAHAISGNERRATDVNELDLWAKAKSCAQDIDVAEVPIELTTSC